MEKDKRKKSGSNTLPIVLSVSNHNYVSYDEDYVAKDTEFRKMKEECLKRDSMVCRFCKFKSQPSRHKFTEVFHLDGNHKNNSLDNLATTCSLCHSCFHIDRVGTEGIPNGVLIFAPEFDQAQINHIVRTYFYAESYKESIKSTGKDMAQSDAKIHEITQGLLEACSGLYTALKGRATLCDELIGTSNPKALGSVLENLLNGGPEEQAIYEDRENRLFGVRLLTLPGPLMTKLAKTFGPPDGTYIAANVKMWSQIHAIKLSEIEKAEGRKKNV